MAGLNLPKGTSMNHTIDSLKRLTAAVEEQEGIKGIIGIAGVDILSDTPQSDAGILYVALEEWDEREKAQASLDSIMEQTDDTAKRIVPEAEVFLVNPPSIYGLSSTGGISMYLQDVTGHTDEELLAVVQEVTAAMEEREELAQVEPEFSVAFPYMDFSVDEDKVKEMGVSLADVYQTMQVNFGGEEVNNFTRFGQVHKVVLQGDAPYRIGSGALDYLFVRNEAGKNVPLATLVQAAESTGPVNIARYNGLHSIYFEAVPKDGYSLGEAMDAMEEAVESSAAEGFRIRRQPRLFRLRYDVSGDASPFPRKRKRYCLPDSAQLPGGAGRPALPRLPRAGAVCEAVPRLGRRERVRAERQAAEADRRRQWKSR